MARLQIRNPQDHPVSPRPWLRTSLQPCSSMTSLAFDQHGPRAIVIPHLCEEKMHRDRAELFAPNWKRLIPLAAPPAPLSTAEN